MHLQSLITAEVGLTHGMNSASSKPANKVLITLMWLTLATSYLPFGKILFALFFLFGIILATVLCCRPNKVEKINGGVWLGVVTFCVFMGLTVFRNDDKTYRGYLAPRMRQFHDGDYCSYVVSGTTTKSGKIEGNAWIYYWTSDNHDLKGKHITENEMIERVVFSNQQRSIRSESCQWDDDDHGSWTVARSSNGADFDIATANTNRTPESFLLGKAWKTTTRFQSGYYLTQVSSITAKQTITVPAGTFNCWVQIDEVTSPRWTSTQTTWMAPEVGIVREKVHLTEQSDPSSSVDMTLSLVKVSFAH